MSTASEPTTPPKAAPPPLNARAPRPPVVRLRRATALTAALGGAGLLAGALVWAFVVQPELRAHARAAAHAARDDAARGAVRPSEAVTKQPASYDRLPTAKLPAPRGLGGSRDESAGDLSRPAPSSSRAQPLHPPDAVRARSPTDLARASDLFFTGRSAGEAPPSAAAPAGSAPTADPATYNPHQLQSPVSPFELKAGTVIAASLLTSLDTTRPGPVVAVLTEDVYDTVSGRICLAPQGSRLLGRQDGASRYGDRRAYLVWDRLILPNGKSLVLEGAAGVDAEGASGVPGRVDRRLLPLGIASLFAGAITTLGEAARSDHASSGGLLGDAGDAAAIEAAQVGGRLVDRELQVTPSIRVEAGARVHVLVTRDLILEPYAP